MLSISVTSTTLPPLARSAKSRQSQSGGPIGPRASLQREPCADLLVTQTLCHERSDFLLSAGDSGHLIAGVPPRLPVDLPVALLHHLGSVHEQPDPRGHGGEEALIAFAEVLLALADDRQDTASLASHIHGHIDLAADAERLDHPARLRRVLVGVAGAICLARLEDMPERSGIRAR